MAESRSRPMSMRARAALDTDDGLRLAGSMMPPGEGAAGVLNAIEPWLVETRRTRSASMRHGPDGAEPTDQRSCRVQAQHAR